MMRNFALFSECPFSKIVVSNSMEEIDRLQYNPGVVLLSSFYMIIASLKVEEHVVA